MPPDRAPSPSAAPPEASRESVLREIARVLKAELQLPREVNPEDDLARDLELDSVSVLTLVVELENAFQIALREEDAASVRTVAELAELVVARAAETRGAAGTP